MESGVYEVYTAKFEEQPVCAVCEQPYEHSAKEDPTMTYKVRFIKASTACVHLKSNYPAIIDNDS
jgi:hypothetical protein